MINVLKEMDMLKARLIASAAAVALVAGLGGCASAGSGASSPYAGPHNHVRDAKQGAGPSVVQPAAPYTRKSLRPAS